VTRDSIYYKTRQLKILLTVKRDALLRDAISKWILVLCYKKKIEWYSIIDCKTQILVLTVLTEQRLFNCIYKTSIIDCKTQKSRIPLYLQNATRYVMPLALGMMETSRNSQNTSDQGDPLVRLEHHQCFSASSCHFSTRKEHTGWRTGRDEVKGGVGYRKKPERGISFHFNMLKGLTWNPEWCLRGFHSGCYYVMISWLLTCQRSRKMNTKKWVSGNKYRHIFGLIRLN